MEITYKDNKKLNITIKSKDITGIYSTDINNTLKIIKNINKNQIITEIDKKEQNIFNIYKKVCIIDEISDKNKTKTVNNYFNYVIDKYNIDIKDEIKKKKDALKLVHLTVDKLNINISTLSNFEKYKVLIAAMLIVNPKVLIFKEPFQFFDLKNEAKFLNLLRKLKDQFNKIIIIIDTNIDKLFKYIDRIIYIDEDKIILDSTIDKLEASIETLKQNKMPISKLYEFTYKVLKEKNVKLTYFTDIRDLIKDIYKHV